MLGMLMTAAKHIYVLISWHSVRYLERLGTVWEGWHQESETKS